MVSWIICQNYFENLCKGKIVYIYFFVLKKTWKNTY
jgi:hypothetical protein